MNATVLTIYFLVLSCWLAQAGKIQSLDGKTYEGLRTQGSEAFAPCKFVAPHAASFDPDGNIFVAEWVEMGRITKLRKVA